MVRLGFLILFSTILFSVGATADTLELTNGKTMSGTFVGREGESIRFEVDGIIMTVPAANVTNISIGAAAAAPAASAPVATPAPVPVVAAPAPAPAPTAKPTVEAGRALTIRLKETLTTGKQGPGYKFTGTLEGALVVDGITVAPMGSLIYGLVQKSKASGRGGKCVVILLDSITRLARAHNTIISPSGKVLSGGVDSNALQRPKRFFGAARNLEEGGSLTIL
ncbi:hypothetical protein LCGC14_2639650, partial [marine sediment metagenome]